MANALTLASLSPDALAKINACQWDGIIEKHEGPEQWSSTLRFHDPDFMKIAGRSVLLPVSRERHVNITILRCQASEDGSNLTIFLKDTTYSDGPENEQFDAGFMAVCDKVAGEQFFLAIVYHEWFIIENGSLLELS